MRILSSEITHARRLRDFGCVEAVVTLLVKSEGRVVPHEVRVLTSVPLHGATPLRDRLLTSATQLHALRQRQRPAAATMRQAA
ncbi:hypothetical protein [Frigidibacter oleivorans]|uniref:hypothetical protein n=1 Tax=Frigidibacter oleivorans TaxID=2487129 RepID=UPI001F3A47C2|nr:hypothetical protein [Frigidibacter oleivorans]